MTARRDPLRILCLLVEHDLTQPRQSFVQGKPISAIHSRDFIQRLRHQRVADFLPRALAGDEAGSTPARPGASRSPVE